MKEWMWVWPVHDFRPSDGPSYLGVLIDSWKSWQLFPCSKGLKWNATAVEFTWIKMRMSKWERIRNEKRWMERKEGRKRGQEREVTKWAKEQNPMPPTASLAYKKNPPPNKITSKLVLSGAWRGVFYLSPEKRHWRQPNHGPFSFRGRILTASWRTSQILLEPGKKKHSV